MGTGWRRAFCTSVRRDPEAAVLGGGARSHSHSQSSPSTPRNSNSRAHPHSPFLHCKTTATTSLYADVATPLKSGSASARAPSSSSSTSSPSRFNLLKAALRLSRNRCGICAESVRTGGERTTAAAAVFTAQCSHSFHFHCITAHVRSQGGSLICPVCSTTWQDVPLLSSSYAAPSTPKSQPQPRERRTTTTNNTNNTNSSSRAKIYNDDESLLQLSPTAQFNPIPEEFEADDEDSNNEASDAIDPNFITLDSSSSSSSTAVLVYTSKTHLSYVVPIKLKAPPQIPTPLPKNPSSSAIPAPLLDQPSFRAPIDLVTVLDASGTMTAAKLQMLKRAMRLLLSSLGPGDRLSIVAFSAVAAKRLLPLRRMSCTGQRSARQIVDRLVVCGSNSQAQQPEPLAPPSSSKSCVGDALRKATKVLEDRRERNPVATIMLLSDVHDHQQMYNTTRFTHVDIIPINGAAAQQKQKQKQKQSSLPLDVNSLVSLVLQDVHLSFALPSTSGTISSIYSYLGGCTAGIARAVAHGEGGRSVRIGDMFADEERHLLVEIKVPKSAVEQVTSIHLSAECSYRDPVTRDTVRCGERTLLAPMHCRSSSPGLFRFGSFTSSSSAAASGLEQLQMRSVFVSTRAMAESGRLVELGDLDTAAHLLSSARSLLMQQQSNNNNNNVISSWNKKLIVGLESELETLQRRRKRLMQHKSFSPSIRRRETVADQQPLTPTSAWRAAEQLAKVAIMRKSLNRVSDLHGLENARF